MPYPSFERSFASHPKANCWSSRNQKEAKEVYKGTSTKYWFNCDKCPHEFESGLNGVTGKRERWCPYCTNQRLCNLEEIECQNCFEKTFASHLRAKQWSKQNEKTSKQVFKSSDSKLFVTFFGR
jgi:DNA-directed RNA polymerase subunit RPC12/RpoP